MTKKKSKNKKVLAASMILAAMIVAGSSFAWFTSSDEVVNKLSAQNKYAVTVTESFTPPEQWLPGQTVEKEAGAINTGNIDAFVKLTLSNELVLTTYGTPEEYNAANTAKYITLTEAEVTSLQAGGQLVYNNGGLVVYQRITKYNTDGSVAEVEYAGYYDDGTNKYALAEITAPTGEGTDFTATLQTMNTTQTVEPTLTYDSASNKVVATYGTGEETITININLANNHTDNWTNNTGTTEFYYNSILAAGAATGNLVESVELDSSVTNKAFVAMDYNLSVKADSVQVTTGTDKAEAVNASWGTNASVTGTDVNWNI